MLKNKLPEKSKLKRDFIFIVGASGVGKTTLAKKLFKHYKSTYVEQYMIPEFLTQDGKKEVTGKLEEKTLFTSMVVLLKNFYKLGYRNVIALDFNDLRCRDIPQVFKKYNFITIKLICSNLDQHRKQMKERKNGLIDFDLLEKSVKKIHKRCLLINEFQIDIANKTADEVFNEAVLLIDRQQTQQNYRYVKPPKSSFTSWVLADNL